jgi:uncharacterized Rossmann fold enzyme
MEIEKWLVFYDEILKEFRFSKERDRESALLLNTFLKKPDNGRLECLISGRDVNIFGAGPSLERVGSIPPGPNIAADGACSYLLKRDIVPEVVVTDLDGNIEDILEANRLGALIFLHAHGNNIDLVRRYAADFKNLFGTTQVWPFGNLLNFGGFTDGDRAGFIAEHFSPKKITFYGMNFDMAPGRYSFTKQENLGIKKKKLRWAKRLLEFLKKGSDVEIDFK